MSAPLRIAIAGLGTVGAATLRIVQQQAELLRARGGRTLEVVAVSARDAKKARDISLRGIPWETDALALLNHHPDVVVEVIGGSEGVAKTLVETALQKNISVVTANKALIAHHGMQLAKLAEHSGAVLA